MSAQLADNGPRNSFTAHLALAAGVVAIIHAPTLADLQATVGKLQPSEAANEPVTAKPQAATPAAAQPTGNASASTGIQASAPAAAAGSAASGEGAAVDYKVVQSKVLALSKVKRELALEVLGKFTGINGKPVDHGTKLQLPDYPAFVKAADQALAGAAA